MANIDTLKAIAKKYKIRHCRMSKSKKFAQIGEQTYRLSNEVAQAVIEDVKAAGFKIVNQDIVEHFATIGMFDRLSVEI